MSLRRLLASALCLMWVIPCRAQEPLDLAVWLAKSDLWQTTQKTLPSNGFRWLSDEKRSARISPEAEVTLASFSVGEVVVRFTHETLTSISLDLYARGDNAAVDRAEFMKLVGQASAWLTKHTGQPSRELQATADITKAHHQVWETKQCAYQLSHSFQRERKSREQPFVSEFIRIGVTNSKRFSPAQCTPSWLKEQVQRGPLGDVWIAGVPMIDQGDKGYCVVASAERVLRHYGMDVTQHELAQLAASHREHGTSIGAMTDALRGASRVLKVRVRELYSLFGSRSLKQLVDRYNRLARREKEPLLSYDADFFTKAKPALILSSRIKQAAFARFATDIQQAIQQGTPLLWSVQLGVFPEKESPQAKGGHMRLIIGYHQKNKEVLFTDSWGLGHEKKRLPLDQAFAMTLALSVLEPRE